MTDGGSGGESSASERTDTQRSCRTAFNDLSTALVLVRSRVSSLVSETDKAGSSTPSKPFSFLEVENQLVCNERLRMKDWASSTTIAPDSNRWRRG